MIEPIKTPTLWSVQNANSTHVHLTDRYPNAIHTGQTVTEFIEFRDYKKLYELCTVKDGTIEALDRENVEMSARLQLQIVENNKLLAEKKALQADHAALQADFANLLKEHQRQKSGAVNRILGTHARLEDKIADAVGKYTAEALIALINSMNEEAQK